MQDNIIDISINMSKEIAPSWLVKRYMKLWEKFEDKDFSFEDAQKTLKEDNKFLSVVLSEMKKEGWLTLELDPEDARKRLYKLLSLEEVMKKTAEKAVNIFKTDSKESSATQINIVNGGVIHGDVKNIKNGEDNKD
ncbi:MAG: hypothetical protein OH338_03730 [Candidatus Parvarchaeota archaeon]|nr:hypothetical protein [Candidatus Parvarchaeum tengchongense]MCW1298817.1 hypothetical protein [Candidatus Parvarchaeum tengchongense]MCW1312509.1 hypothetical protein [Candidatus Parvarchaeum tengchongense]